MTFLFFNSNSVSFDTSTDIVLGDHIRDGDLYNVRCLCNSWPVDDLSQEWSVTDFPRHSALRIANFLMASSSGKVVEDAYSVILHPVATPGTPIEVFCLLDSKQFYAVATNKESARRLAEADNKEVWITVVVNIVTFRESSWPELSVHRQNSDNWAKAWVEFS